MSAPHELFSNTTPSEAAHLRPPQLVRRMRGPPRRGNGHTDMATINDLPAETLHHILDIMHYKDEDVNEEDLGKPEHEELYESNLSALISASLVARKWQGSAQSSSWIRLLVSKESHLVDLLANPLLGSMRTELLEVTGPACCSKLLGELVGKLIGLKSIRILPSDEDEEVLMMADDAWLGSPALQKLKFLELGVGVLPENSTLASTNFQLSHLELSAEPWSPAAVQAILQSSKLKSASFSIIQPTLHRIILSAFPIFGSSLKTLEICADMDNIELYAHHLTSLTTLNYTCHDSNSIAAVDKLIRAFPSQEKQFVIFIFKDAGEVNLDSEVPGSFLGLWERGNWIGQTRINFDVLEVDFRALYRGSELLDLCVKWGVLLNFSDSY
ncbi:hypothetical protein P7C70_g4736, partial [Phenoliferia sp. Uapishka_3]